MILKLLKAFHNINITAFLFVICILLLVVNYVNILSLNEANKKCKELIENYDVSLKNDFRAKYMRHEGVSNNPTLPSQLELTTTAPTTTRRKISSTTTSQTTESNLTINANSTADEKKTANLLQFPAITNLLHHLKDHPQKFTHRIEITQNRQAKFVIGIPTVKRGTEVYLVDTLKSLLKAMNSQETEDVLIVVFATELTSLSFAEEVMALVVENFGPEVRKGLIDILAPDSDFYPDFDMIKVRDFIFSDDENRIKWRMKQNYDYSYLMTYCAQRGEFYIQLEDDIKSNDGFLTDIQMFMNLLSVENETRWLMLEFCNLGFIGKLVRTRDLQMFVNVFLMFAEIKPVDQLHNVVFEAISCNPEKAFSYCKKNFNHVKIPHKTALFQHIGIKSSLPGKMQRWKDKRFKEKVNVVAHSNPDAFVSTTLTSFEKKFKIANTYLGREFFWANNIIKGQYILITFDQPFALKSFVIRSGSSTHPDDLIPEDTSIEVRLVNLDQETKIKVEKLNLTKTSEDFFILERFTVEDRGEIYREYEADFILEITDFRMVIGKTVNNWILLTEVGIS